jgi:lysyl-tRNA synthetase class 2
MPSSVIDKIDYEEEHAQLTVRFTTGRVYQYFLVPADVAAAFRLALSKGTYFNTKIRDHYTFRDITPPGQPVKRSAR